MKTLEEVNLEGSIDIDDNLEKAKSPIEFFNEDSDNNRENNEQ